MKIFSFKAALAAIHRFPLYRHPSSYMWKNSLSINSQFCDAVVAAGFLTFEQMVDAACRYCLGATKSRGVIFWQIDHEGRIHDGKIMWYGPDCHRLKSKKPCWVSYLLRRRSEGFYSKPSALHSQLYTLNSTLPHISSHCFFGTHLLTSSLSALYSTPSTLNQTIAIVEAEKTALILSELYPDYIWMAAGGLGEVQPDKFRPLRGYRVILFPDTDPNGIAYKRWYEAAQFVMRQPFWEKSPPIRVSALLERHASEEQKMRKIDLVDFLFEAHTESTESTESILSSTQNLTL